MFTFQLTIYRETSSATPLLHHQDDEIPLLFLMHFGLRNACRRPALKTYIRDILIKANTPLIFEVINRHFNGISAQYAGREEMVQQGFVGLMQAIQMYNPVMGYRFSTFAFLQIRGAITPIIRNTAKAMRTRRGESFAGSSDFHDRSGVDVAEAICRRHQIEQLRTLIFSLPEKQRNILQAYCQGERADSIATRMRVARSTVHRTLRAAILALRQHMCDEN